MDVPFFDRLAEDLGARKRSTRSPQPQTIHVSHVLGLGGASGRSVDDACHWNALLELQHSLARLGRLGLARRYQVLGAVALVEDYDAVEVGSEPVDELVEAGLELVAAGGSAPDQGRVGAEEDAAVETDFPAVDLHVLHLLQVTNECHDSIEYT